MRSEPTKKEIQIQKLQKLLFETNERLVMYKNNIIMYHKLIHKRDTINRQIKELEEC